MKHLYILTLLSGLLLTNIHQGIPPPSVIARNEAIQKQDTLDCFVPRNDEKQFRQLGYDMDEYMGKYINGYMNKYMNGYMGEHAGSPLRCDIIDNGNRGNDNGVGANLCVRPVVHPIVRPVICPIMCSPCVLGEHAGSPLRNKFTPRMV